MLPKKQHVNKQTRRHLSMLALLVVLFGGLAFGIRFMNFSPTLLLPEMREAQSPPCSPQDDAHRDELMQVVDYSWPQYIAWAKEHESLTRSVRSSVSAATMMDCQRAGTTLCFALERFQRDTGAYPEALDAIAPKYLGELPNDPFSGQPFLYHKEGTAYTLSSVGDGRGKGELKIVGGELP